MYKLVFKRVFDIIISFVSIILLSPLFIIIIVLLLFANEGAGVFFTQERPGLHGRIFKIIKFKTMNERKGLDGQLLRDTLRITKVGRIIRDSSLDELPQLFNVLKGDMAIIGPRPLLVQYLPLYSQEQMRRHEVRPGITGWAQCHGRNAISWTERFKLDVWYVDHLSLKVDLDVIFATIKKVIARDGITGGGEVTMQLFDGTN